MQAFVMLFKLDRMLALAPVTLVLIFENAREVNFNVLDIPVVTTSGNLFLIKQEKTEHR